MQEMSQLQVTTTSYYKYYHAHKLLFHQSISIIIKMGEIFKQLNVSLIKLPIFTRRRHHIITTL